MSTIDVDQLKRVLTQATFRRPAGPTITRSRASRSPELRREVEDGIKSVLTGGRLDPNRLAKLRELNQNELRRGAEQRAAADARPAADNTSFIRGIQETRKTLELISHSDRL